MIINPELTIEKAELLKILSSPLRLCIVHQLAHDDECNVSHFVNCMNFSQPSISQALAKLKSANIVKTDKRGNEIYYSLISQEVRDIINLLFAENN